MNVRKQNDVLLLLVMLSITVATTSVTNGQAPSTAGTIPEAVTLTLTVDPSTKKVTVADPTGGKPNPEGGVVTKISTMTVNVPIGTGGMITPFIGGVNRQPAIALTPAAGSAPISLPVEGTYDISFVYKGTDGVEGASSNVVRVRLDSTGPRFDRAEIVETPTTGTTLLMHFKDRDFSPSISKTAFSLERQSKAGVFDEKDTVTTEEPQIDGNTLRMPIKFIPAGEYRLKLIPEHLKDIAGNEAVKEKLVSSISVLSSRTFGEHVEFTPYAPPTKQTIPKEGFNPGDFVETRVARLFYFRDATRVAQIINRNIRSYNESAVTLAERRAENSRDDADDLTDERRKNERAAVRAAEQARNAEQQLAQAQQTLAEAQALDNQIASDTDEQSSLASSLPTGAAAPTPEEVAAEQRTKQLKAQIKANTDKHRILGTTTEIAAKVATMQQSVANLRQTELNSQDATNDSEAKEARARATQFRNEVTAAETDPDTYVAGKMDSADPVTQCSLSVIGEGLIQIRGPIKGINKIRTMINQIDSPVGQIKIGIFTVQVNGEEGHRMERVAGDAEGFIDLSRFLVNQSLNMLRRAIQSEAAAIATQCELEGHYQVDRDRRYLYGFFGRDFIDELYEMNSEFLLSENKVLSLHSMDTISFNRAMFILALAKNDVRERIVQCFLESVKTELPDAEFDFRRSSELKPHKTEKHFPPWNRTHLPVDNHYHKEEVIYEAVHRNALQRYHFRNFNSFFDTGFTSPDTMNPMQREFIRMAQIFKARLVAEMELKQRVMERSLIEDRSNSEEARFAVMQRVHSKALLQLEETYSSILIANTQLQGFSQSLSTIFASASSVLSRESTAFTTSELGQMFSGAIEHRGGWKSFYDTNAEYKNLKHHLAQLASWDWLSVQDHAILNDAVTKANAEESGVTRRGEPGAAPPFSDIAKAIDAVDNRRSQWITVKNAFAKFSSAIEGQQTTADELDKSYQSLQTALEDVSDTQAGLRLMDVSLKVYTAKRNAITARSSLRAIDDFLEETRGDLDHRKLLNLMIDEQEDKFIELVEGTRSHIAVMDQYLKRLSIAIEDDFKTQFYDPAFIRVREAARLEAVNLSQVERTTILTNNRDFAKVDPQATMEFDLPKRQIAIKEAFDAAKALVEDTGALVNDPTFLSAFQMMGGSQQPSTVKNLVPGQSMSTDQQIMGIVPPAPAQSSPGSALQSLVPEPSIFKLETGTGFQIRPVMEPDGDSAVYDFDYMYTTNIREPVRADEKHIGRIKRHFVHTAVQTGNFELREISRYLVALKVSRTSQGVPLLQDIPVVGRVFRPAPSADSSIQQNIIFGQTNIYPTLFDLMGLRWAQQVVDLDHTSLLESEHVIRGRQKSMKDYVFGTASKRVDEFLNVQTEEPDSYRTDFYHEKSLSSPYHPNGYRHPMEVTDPSGRNFEQIDRRPADMQEPPYDRYRHRPVYPERIAPPVLPEPVLQEDDAPDESYYQSSTRPSGLQPLPASQAVRLKRFNEAAIAARSANGQRNDRAGGPLQTSSIQTQKRVTSATHPDPSSDIMRATYERSGDKAPKTPLRRLPPIR